MAQMFSDNAQVILNFLQDNPNVNMTANDLAESISLSPRTVNGCVTGLARRKPALAYREEVEVDGKKVKYVHLTEEGFAADPFAEKK